MKVALTGATGNMGRETLASMLKIKELEFIRLLVLPEDKRIKALLKIHKKNKNKIEVVYGNLKDRSACDKLIAGVDYVFNLAAVIPPLSDKAPQKAIDCNQLGVDSLVSAIEALDVQPKLVHISTVALYGNRNHLHPWAQAGDPLLVSPFDVYSVSKLRGEFRVLESKVNTWVVIRQTAMLHRNMLKDNMKDGLMFHTCFNAPLEWVTAEDSGVLMANIIKKDIEADLSGFWKKIYNLGGGLENCITGYDTLNDGFKLIGGSTKDFFKPYYNATRNFHGVWFSDGDRLEELFHYQSQNVKYYWKQIGKIYWYYKLGKIVPKGLISKFAIKRLFKDDNSPAYWYKHKEEAKLIAYFGSKENYEKLLKNKWKDFPLLVENQSSAFEEIDYLKLKDKSQASRVNYFFDFDKSDDLIDIHDLRNVAEAHGGRLITTNFTTGDIYSKLEWENQDHQAFTATAFSVLRGGHWMNPTYTDIVWDFDRLAKKDKIYASLWYDSHREDENYKYSMDSKFQAKVEDIK
ncbi:MAG: NAD-dependent epimerase/dehydratase family protein [Anaeroplasmataceae bacterium]|nr:NAD-dependent epimerase/dehydratase family protein [Anaeroplasmataceae bacterium]